MPCRSKLPPLGQRWNINIQLAQRNASEESSPSMHACMAHATQDDKNTRALRPPAYPDDAECAVRIHHTLPPVSVCLSLVVKRTRTAGRRHRRHRGKALSESAEKMFLGVGDGTGQPITHGVPRPLPRRRSRLAGRAPRHMGSTCPRPATRRPPRHSVINPCSFCMQMQCVNKHSSSALSGAIANPTGW